MFHFHPETVPCVPYKHKCHICTHLSVLDIVQLFLFICQFVSFEFIPKVLFKFKNYMYNQCIWECNDISVHLFFNALFDKILNWIRFRAGRTTRFMGPLNTGP